MFAAPEMEIDAISSEQHLVPLAPPGGEEIVDGIIDSPKTAQMTAGISVDALLDQGEVADAVRFLAGQSHRGMTHELVLTPSGSVWVP